VSSALFAVLVGKFDLTRSPDLVEPRFGRTAAWVSVFIASSILDLVVWFKARGLCEYYWKISNADDYIDETGTFATFINLLEEPLSDCF